MLSGKAGQALYRAKQGGRNRVCSVNQARPARP
jgi:PleD family two-component response regulator